MRRRLIASDPFARVRSRVMADGGIIEDSAAGRQGLLESMRAGRSSYRQLTVPYAVKAGKLFGLLPFDASADWACTRAGTTGTRVNRAGIIENVAANVPRISWDGGAPTILVEAAATNLCLYSEDISNAAAWSGPASGTGVTPTLTKDYEISPRGIKNAARLQMTLAGGTTSGDVTTWQQTFGGLSNPHTILGYIYVKSNAGNVTVGLQYQGLAISLITVTNSWQKFVVTATRAATSTYFRLVLQGSTTSNSADLSVWGSQFVIGTNESSFIPTTGSAETRNADVLTIAPPAGTAKITLVPLTGANTEVTTIPETYTIPAGQWKQILFT